MNEPETLERIVESLIDGDEEMRGTVRAVLAAVTRLVAENQRLAAKVRELGGPAVAPEPAEAAEVLERLGGSPFAGDDVPDAAFARHAHETALPLGRGEPSREVRW